jgi:hypothetical protein
MKWQSFSKLLPLLKIFDYKGCNEYNIYMQMSDISNKKDVKTKTYIFSTPCDR